MSEATNELRVTQQFLNTLSTQDGADNELRTTQQFVNILTKNPSGKKPIILVIV
jgi:hypothetical protein